VSLSRALYTATATAEGGREGRTTSDDGRLDLTVSTPSELGGPGTGTNPEQLFAAGFASCFHSALKIVARKARQDAEKSTVTAHVSLGPRTEGPGWGLQVRLVAFLPGLDQEIAQELVAKADKVCPYSNATRGNIQVTHDVIT
jgi:lipoyl-dependent peroxiredoxin